MPGADQRHGLRVIAVEAKSGATLSEDAFRGLRRLQAALAEAPATELDPRVVYGGEQGQTRHGIRAVPWSAVQDVDWGSA